MTITPTRHSEVEIEGAPFAALTEEQAVEFIMAGLDQNRGGWVIPMNVDVLLRWSREPAVRELCSEADLFLADGMPLIWASALQGTPLPQRVAGSTLLGLIAKSAAQHSRSIYLLGGDAGTADQAAQALQSSHKGLRVVGTHCPPMGFEKNEAEMQRIRQSIAETRPDIVFVGLGFPKQERLIAELRPLSPRTWWMGVGVTFSFLSGRVKRAPKFLQWMGMEWIHRMAQEPERLGHRYLIDDVPFAIRLLTRSAMSRRRFR